MTLSPFHMPQPIAVIPTLLHKRFTKLQGILLLALYIAYVFVTVRI